MGTLGPVTMFRRKPKSTAAPVDDAQPEPAAGPGQTKGRPTPKQRQSGATRGPATPAPKTRKEAVRYQRERLKAERAATKEPTTPATRRAAMLAGDPNALPRRDKGPVRKLARDYADSHRMMSNYLLILLPVLLLGFLNPVLSFVLWILVLCFVVEWILIGRKIRNMALERKLPAKESAFAIGFYTGSRAYLPRRWRMPRPTVKLGDAI